MASQDNPETWLCPNLRAPRTPPAALRPLVFSPTSTRQPAANGAVLPQRRNNTTYVRSPPPQDAKSLNKPRSSNATGDEEPRIQKIPSHEETGIPRKREKGAETQAPGFTIHEKSVRKDYRSFAANMFNTVAFKMLEWLTPNSLDAMSRKVKEIQNDSGITPDKPMVASRSEAPAIDNQQHGQGSVQAGRSVHGAGHNSKPDAGEKGAVPSSKPLQNQGTAGSSTTGRARAASAPKPKRQVSVDPFPPAPTPEDILAGLGSPQMASGLPTDGVRKGIKPQLSRRMSQLNASTFVDPVRRDEMAPPSTVALAPEVNADKADADRVVPSPLVESPSTQTSSKPDARAKAGCRTKDSVPAVDYDRYLPQTLSVLNLEIIDLFCDILEDGGPSTASHMLEPQRIPRKKRRVPSQYPPLKRQREPNASRNRALQHEWNQFINQTFFSVLGDPKALIRSFSTENGIFDSQTLWYCLLRITRAAPSVALDSLWRAAAALFELPQSVQSLRSPTSKAFRKTGPSLSNSEAADLMAICLHALVAVAPLVDDPRQLLDMSRIRSHGLRLSGSGAIAKQPVELCLQYEDAFSNELALRLARRLFTAITTRNRFDDVVELSCDLGEGPTQCHILETVLSQMDSFNNDMPSILLFSPEERAAHEKRVPILLLDWARTVMMNDWDGQPEVNGDGPVGGALELIKTMCEYRTRCARDGQHS